MAITGLNEVPELSEWVWESSIAISASGVPTRVAQCGVSFAADLACGQKEMMKRPRERNGTVLQKGTH